jgi:aspartyl-tRNA(Asn)/glutamyl-tRNA(Gln) amidotransferase subunit C
MIPAPRKALAVRADSKRQRARRRVVLVPVCRAAPAGVIIGRRTMSLSVDEVRRIALLARLRLSPEEEALFAPQLGQILDYVAQLETYATAPASPEETPGLEDHDTPGPSMSRDDLLGNAPATLDAFVLVPQVKVTADE